MSSRFNAIWASAHTSWNWRKPTLRTTFYALVWSKRDYAAPVWQPWLSDTDLNSLDHLQSQTVLFITGAASFTKLYTLKEESKVITLKADTWLFEWGRRICAVKTTIQYKLTYRTTSDNALKHVLVSAIKQQSFHPSFQKNLIIVQLSISSHPHPWLGSSFCINQVSPSITSKSGQSDPLVLKLEKSLACNSSFQVNHTIYTDGSTSSSTSNGELQQSSPQVFLLNLLLCQASFTIH